MITSTSNTQIKNLTALMKKSKERKKQGVFVVEGRKMVDETPKDLLQAVYMSEGFASKSQYVNKDIACEIVSDAIFKAISDTQTPQGILAIVKIPKYELSDMLDAKSTQLLILDSIQDPGNLGTMIRTGEGAGITGVVMNKTTVDLFNPKTIRSTMGSIYRVPFLVVDDLSSTVIELKQHGVKMYAAHLKGEQSYDMPDYTTACGFLIGNEGNGLSDEIAALSDEYIRIPMHGSVESLNAAISAALLMYECSRQRRNANENLV